MKKIKLSLLALSILTIAIIFSCKKQNFDTALNYSSEPTLPQTVDNYSASTNDNLATLGRVLFYDRKLSLNNSISCGSCHKQEVAFSDGKQFSVGLEDIKSTRNTPAIFPKFGKMFWDGRADSLAQLVLMPIANHTEMKIFDFDALISKLKNTTYYPGLFNKAFGTNDISQAKIQKALKEFILNFNFSKNKFSSSVATFTNTNPIPLNTSESIGKDVFFGKGNCSGCHHIQPNGYGNTSQWHNIGLDEVYADNGIGGFTNNQTQNGAFMVPVLLNVELTAPYMHDGRFKTLEEVVEHYNSGVKNNPNLDWMFKDFSMFDGLTDAQIIAQFDTNHNGEIEESELPQGVPKKLNLTITEKKGLVDFLKTLTDRSVLSDARFSDPFLK
jgi:cytochrome c peroxidase